MTNPAFTRILDDPYGSTPHKHSDPWTGNGDLPMIADYTADPDHYSDGSPVGYEYIPNDVVANVISFQPGGF